MPAMMKINTMAILMITMTLLTLADSCTPVTSKTVTAAMINIAGMLTIAPVDDQWCAIGSNASGAEESFAGTWMPRPFRKLTT